MRLSFPALPGTSFQPNTVVVVLTVLEPTLEVTVFVLGPYFSHAMVKGATILGERVNSILESVLSSLTHCSLVTTPDTVNGVAVLGIFTLRVWVHWFLSVTLTV